MIDGTCVSSRSKRCRPTMNCTAFSWNCGSLSAFLDHHLAPAWHKSLAGGTHIKNAISSAGGRAERIASMVPIVTVRIEMPLQKRAGVLGLSATHSYPRPFHGSNERPCKSNRETTFRLFGGRTSQAAFEVIQFERVVWVVDASDILFCALLPLKDENSNE